MDTNILQLIMGAMNDVNVQLMAKAVELARAQDGREALEANLRQSQGALAQLQAQGALEAKDETIRILQNHSMASSSHSSPEK